jgi:hypothetical protein
VGRNQYIGLAVIIMLVAAAGFFFREEQAEEAGVEEELEQYIGLIDELEGEIMELERELSRETAERSMAERETERAHRGLFELYRTALDNEGTRFFLGSSNNDEARIDVRNLSHEFFEVVFENARGLHLFVMEAGMPGTAQVNFDSLSEEEVTGISLARGGLIFSTGVLENDEVTNLQIEFDGTLYEGTILESEKRRIWYGLQEYDGDAPEAIRLRGFDANYAPAYGEVIEVDSINDGEGL